MISVVLTDKEAKALILACRWLLVPEPLKNVNKIERTHLEQAQALLEMAARKEAQMRKA